MKKRVIAMLLAGFLLFSMNPIDAFAESTSEPITVNDETGDVNLSTVKESNKDCAVMIFTETEDGKVSVDAKNVTLYAKNYTSDYTEAVIVKSCAEGATVTVNAKCISNNVNDKKSIVESATALSALASSEGVANVNVANEIKADNDSYIKADNDTVEKFGDATGINAAANNGGTVNIKAKEVNSSSLSGDAVGICANAEDSGEVNIDIGESVVSSAKGSSTGVKATVQDGGAVNVNIGGDIDTKDSIETIDSAGIDVEATGESSSADVHVGGSIKKADECIRIFKDENSSVNIVVEGKLAKSSTAPIVFSGSDKGIDITVFEIVSDGSPLVKEKTDGGGLEYTERAKEIEAGINYIIRIESNRKITLSGTTQKKYVDAAGKEHVYETAKAGARIDVDPKDIKKMISGKSNFIEENGKYYFIVPKCGGVKYTLTFSSSSSRPNKRTEYVYGDSGIAQAGTAYNPYALTGTVGNKKATVSIEEQGAAASAAFAEALPIGYNKAFTFNINLNLGAVAADAVAADNIFTLKIPDEYRKQGRVFKVMGLTENGKVVIFDDKDFSDETITVNLNNNEGYAFELIYSD